MNFDPKRAMATARGLAYPRLAGAGGDERAVAQIRAWLEDAGWRVRAEPFTFWGSFDTFLKLQLAAADVLIAAGMLGGSAVPAALLLVLVAGLGRLHRWAREHAVVEDDALAPTLPERILRWLGPRIDGVNLVAERDVPDVMPDRPVVYVMAHSDSKGQAMPLVLRMTLFAGVLLGGLTFAVLTLLGLVVPALAASAWPFGALAVLASLPLFWLDHRNTSPGAIDDAAGAGVVLELARQYATDPGLAARVDLRPVVTGAEEWALMGSTSFARRHAEAMHHEGARVLNFDGVGIEGGLRLVEGNGSSGGGLAGHVRSAGEAIGIPVGRFPAVGALFDHIPFSERGIDAVSMIAIGRASASVHTPDDSAARLSERGFERIGRLSCAVIQKMAGFGKESQ